MTNRLRSIPAVEKLVQALGPLELPRPIVVDITRKQLEKLRASDEALDFDAVLAQVRHEIGHVCRARLQPVINGTGIVIHTNLGRAPLPLPALKVLEEVGANYNNLEFNVDSGERGGRAAYLENCLALLCHAEAATVVNNCAAALLLALHHFCHEKKEVIISRGELVQIGGGFRVPEILEASGAKLVEVGTTNRTSLADYERAISPQTGLILKVHRSNFYMAGFVESPPPSALAALGRARQIPVVEDLGSGALIPTENITGLAHEPTPIESLTSGTDLVCFSGDKLFGGPQAGVIVGSQFYIERLKNDPFYRAVRCDKLILSALQAVVEMYLVSGESAELPILELLRTDCGQLRARAERYLLQLDQLPARFSMGVGKSQAGGGTLPQAEIESVTLDIVPTNQSLEAFGASLRLQHPPVIGFISENRFRLDLRTIFPHQDRTVMSAIRASLQV